MSGDILKEKIQSTLEEYSNDLKRIVGLTKYRIRGYYRQFKQSLDNPKNRFRYLIMASSFVLLILLAGLYTSYGYYYDIASFPLVHAKVGNMYLNDYDYVLLVYLENSGNNGNGSGDYHLANNIPTFGYRYSGYKCENDSTLIFDENLLTTSVNLMGKDACSIYFDLTSSLDLTVNIMLEDTPESDIYSLSKIIPAYGYVYSHYECTNNGEVTYDSKLHKVSLTSGSRDFCNIYFVKEKTDIAINLYVEKEANTKEYISRGDIPSNISYHINSSESYCVNKNNERIDNSLAYTDGYIKATTRELTACYVYLDRDE